jgi:ribonuclease BN (tRNA processing enzyme)
MTLSLTALGGAAAWPNPGQGSSAYLIESSGTAILIDCGPNTLLELRRHTDFRHLSAIIISHCHSDHILDLVPFRYGLVYGPDRNGKRIPIWLPPGGVKRLRMLAEAFGGQGEETDAFWSECFDVTEYDPESDLCCGPLTIAFAPTQHFIECYAMRITANGSSIAYSADTGGIESLVDLFYRADVAIVEATLKSGDPTPRSMRGHLTPEDAGELARKAEVKRLFLTHLWSERPGEVVISAAQSQYAGEIGTITPGLQIDV